jgi:glucarate dehydratase
MRSLRRPGLLLATNTLVVNFEQLAANVLDPAVDGVLLDTCGARKVGSAMLPANIR